MDCNKVATLLLNLRKEKKLTQKQVADQMCLSDKTISKWERGLGLPDVSLLSELSRIYGVNIERLLAGDLEEKDADGGNMKRIKFHRCGNCGNIISSTSDAEVFCCGRTLPPLEASSMPMDHEGDESHRFQIQDFGTEYHITFQHDMTKEHYITFVAYVMSDQVLIKRLYPEQNAELLLPKLTRGELYACCTKHGLWKHRL